MIPNKLKQQVLAVAASGAIAIAAVLVKWHEGRVYVAAPDPIGKLTVCDGHTGPDIIPHKRYTDAECDVLLEKDMAVAASEVDRLVRVPISKYQRAALIDFAFNKGPGNLASSTLLRLTNAGHAAAACGQYQRWVRAGGRVLPGLVNRSDADAWVCGGAR